MPVVQLIIFGIPLLSLVWWIWADRRLSRLGTPHVWRIGFSWVVLGRREIVTAQVPATLYALVLLWGLIFLPLVAIPTILGWSVGSLGLRLFKKIRPAEIIHLTLRRA